MFGWEGGQLGIIGESVARRKRKRRRNPEEGYQGWANWETWNVALWISNDEGLYRLAREFRNRSKPYEKFVEALKEIAGKEPIAFETPDGASWTDSGLDTDALDEMIAEE